MKTNGTLVRNLFVLSILLFTNSSSLLAQPDLVFKNAALETGLDKQVGARYRFSAVKSGIDALVTIDAISTDITIADFDDNANGGFDEAFQPRISAKSNTVGYAQFTITFVKAGTSTPMLMLEVPATSIDVDGNISNKGDTLSEYDEYSTASNYRLDYDMLGTDLSIKTSATSVLGKNNKGVEKPSIDTLAKEAMFSMIYSKISSFTVKIGLSNKQPGATTRQRSVYFKRFNFNNSFLPVNYFLTFSAYRTPKKEAVLNWTVARDNDFDYFVIEKSEDGKNFLSIGEVSMGTNTTLSYVDYANKGKAALYRLKLVEKNGHSSYTNMISVKADQTTSFSVYPSITRESTNISYTSDKEEKVVVCLFNLSGQMMMKKDIQATAGANTVSLDGLSGFAKGPYIIRLQTSGSVNTQRIQLVN